MRYWRRALLRHAPKSAGYQGRGRLRVAEEPITGEPESVRNWHAHVYYDLVESKARAERLRKGIAERFPEAQIGEWHDDLVGPHTKPNFEVAFIREMFGHIVRWLALRHDGLSVLIHPNSTGDHIRDHTIHAIWIGPQLAVNTAKWERQRAMALSQGLEHFDRPV
jgi:DOPA 4,5-dioxygenase